jgi:hypothetical protein
MMSTCRTRLDPNTSRSQMLVGDWKKHDLLSEKRWVEAVQKANAKACERSVGQTFPKPVETAKPPAEVIEINDEMEVIDLENKNSDDMDVDV